MTGVRDLIYNCPKLRGCLKFGFCMDDCERGVVIVEWALIAFGCLIGFIIFFDTAGALSDYMQLSHIAGEGVRTAGKIPVLDRNRHTNLNPTPADETACEQGSATTFPCGHNLIQERMLLMARNAGMFTDVDTIDFTTEFIATNALGTEEDDTVLVEINATYDGLLLNIPLNIEEQGPYLFNIDA